jgi:hypothetical protein
MLQSSVVETDTRLTPPIGLAEIINVFGVIYEFILSDGTLDPRWEAEMLTRITLPFPLPLSWNLDLMVEQIRCHKLLAGAFSDVFSQIQQQGLSERVNSLGGCFSFRLQRAGAKISTHAWGIALDLNTATNAQGTDGAMDPGIIDIFRAMGFTWGGNWAGQRRDPMHFQFCSGY